MPLAPFHPAVSGWFRERFGEPTPPQRRGWPPILEGRNVLVASPTGSGKTLAAFLAALDALFREGERTGSLPDRTRVLYLSPLRALAVDVARNLERPLAEIAARDPGLPAVRVLVRTGDTPAAARVAMARRPPHLLATTPESLHLLLGSDSGRKLLGTVRTVVVDEIHSLARDRRGSFLSLLLERLEDLVRRNGGGPLQRIGLSATQKPLSRTAHFLVGAQRECLLVDEGHLRELDLGIEVPPSPLAAVCSHEVWEEIHARIAALVLENRTTIAFVNTRRLAERIAARLAPKLGGEAVACHHGSLSPPRRRDAEERLRSGRLRLLVATASLELGIDVGEVDLVCQVGASRSIATLLQRVGRAGHGVGRTPKGRIFPLTLDELAEAVALVRSLRAGELDSTPDPRAPLDLLAQQIVAAAAQEAWDEEELFRLFRRAGPYGGLPRSDFDEVVAMLGSGRTALLHRDGIHRRIRGTRRARLVSLTCGGAIPDSGDFEVRLEPEGILLGSVTEDFAVESQAGDVFQLGTAAWRIVRFEPGKLRVVDAGGSLPSIPFWLGEAPSRSAELARSIGEVRAEAAEGTLPPDPAIPDAAAWELAEYCQAGKRALGAVPTANRLVAERSFDETGGMQLVIHSPHGGRINRAFGLALRRAIERAFGFGIQAAANEEAILLSLGPEHSFPVGEIFDFLTPENAGGLLVRALLAAPMFRSRFRWNATRALLLERTRAGKRIPTPIARMRADDLLARLFPDAVRIENDPAGEIDLAAQHPIVRQTIADCLEEAMDAPGFLRLLEGLRDGTIGRVAVDTTESSPFAAGILAAEPWAFLDDAPLEERRTQAVAARRSTVDSGSLGELDPEAIARIRSEAWPDPRDREELHEALLWMRWIGAEEAERGLPEKLLGSPFAGEREPWTAHLRSLEAEGRVVLEEGRWYAAESGRDPAELLRGRLEALGPVEATAEEEPLFLALEAKGIVLRGRFEGKPGWCDRRLLSRIHRSTLERLRREIEPVEIGVFLRFLAAWQHADPARRLDGPRGVAEVLGRLAGLELPAAGWEAGVLPLRIRGYRRDWIDLAIFSGEWVWGRLWDSGRSPIRTAPISFVPRAELPFWLSLAEPGDAGSLGAEAQRLLDLLLRRGASFTAELAGECALLPSRLEEGLSQLVSAGLVTSDGMGALRRLVVPPSRRRGELAIPGRWSLFRRPDGRPPRPADTAELAARQLLRRSGVVFRRLLGRERIPIPWRDLVRALRTLELRGEIRGGRFVAGVDGEQYALPEAIPLLRRLRREEPGGELLVPASDPLNLRGMLTGEERVPPQAKRKVRVA
jgi:ATP-dependent Lhr-like helicase